jgi:hypothetical protein
VANYPGVWKRGFPRTTRRITARAVLVAMLAAGAVLATALPDRAQLANPSKPMDLVAEKNDVNGLPLNPDWYGQFRRAHGTDAAPDIDASAACNFFHNDGGTLRVDQCTTQMPQVDERRPMRGALPDLVGYVCAFAVDEREELERGSVHGHINWMPATYTGDLYFDDFQDPTISFSHVIPGDGDLDFTLAKPDHSGYVKSSAVQDHDGHPTGIVLESNRYELGDFATPFWSEFRRSFETDRHAGAAHDSMKKLPAIAIGLVGIDTKHGAHTELHPLFALMARTSKDGVAPQHWVFFARNWGYEGACSHEEHDLKRDAVKLDAVSFELPAASSATVSNVVTSPSSAAGWVSFRTAAATGTGLLTIRLPADVPRPVVVGEFDLCATPCATASATWNPALRGPDPIARVRADRRSEEGRLDPLLAMLTGEQRAAFFAGLQRRNATGESARSLYDAFETAAGGDRNARRLLDRFAAGVPPHAGGE